MIDSIVVPDSIRLLFDNHYLNYSNVMSVLYFRNNTKKGITISELAYYNTYLNNMSNIELDKYFDLFNFHNNYLSELELLRHRLLQMSNMNLITISGDLSDKYENLKIKLSDNGFRIFEVDLKKSLNIKLKNIEYVCVDWKYSKARVNKLLEGVVYVK